MKNAKSELLEELKLSGSTIKCALLKDVRCFDEKEHVEFALPVGYTNEQLDAFYTSLDFWYDSGFGMQELKGIVWLQDGTWLERGEYDGSEWWEHKVLPEIPAKLTHHSP